MAATETATPMGEIKLAPVAANPPDIAKESPIDFRILILPGRIRDVSSSGAALVEVSVGWSWLVFVVDVGCCCCCC